MLYITQVIQLIAASCGLLINDLPFTYLEWSELNAVNLEPKNLCLPCWLFIRLHLRFLKVLKIFSGSPWETKRSDDLSEARPLSLQPKAFHIKRRRRALLVLKPFVHFPKNARKMTTHWNISVRSDTNQVDASYRVCVVTIPIWSRARALHESSSDRAD